MRIPTVDSTDTVYKCGRDASITWKSISFPEFREFTRSVQDLMNAIGELDEDDYWFSLLRRVRRFRFDALAAPLSENLLRTRLTELLADLRGDSERFGKSHPDAVPQYRVVLQTGEHLAQTRLSYLLLGISALLNEPESRHQTAILVCETRLVPVTELAMASAGITEVVVSSPTYLREDHCFKTIIVVGPTRWYPQYVFSAPRGEVMLVIKYDWIRDRWKHENAFTAPIKQQRSKLMETVLDEPATPLSIEADNLRPAPFDFQSIAKSAAQEILGHDEVDAIQARLFLLEDGWAVFLEADEASSVLVIDLADVGMPVKKIKASEIDVGMYVLLRTGGGGDFIVPIADQIMGEAGLRAREHQHHWKQLLRSRVVQEGFPKLVKALRAYGADRANPSNIRNWMSGRSIRTESRADFDAIMKALGLDAESSLYWTLMAQIDHAHRKAGHRIREMLLDSVRSANLSTLKRTGRMDFELRGEHNTSITAFRIGAISPDTFGVIPGRIGEPMKQDS